MKQTQLKRAARVAWAAALAAALGGCGGGATWSDPSRWFGDAAAPPTAKNVDDGGFTVSQSAGAPAASTQPVSEADLVAADGTCAAAPAESSAQVIGVTLAMTECALVQIAGTPERVDIGAADGQRRTVLTYSSGPHPGIYTFIAGRLKIVDQVPGAERPEPRRRTPARRGST